MEGARSSFADRHVGPGDADVARMLEGQGAADLEAFLEAVVPVRIRTARPPEFGPLEVAGIGSGPLSEEQALAAMEAFKGMNSRARSMIGLGYHGCLLPSPIRRQILENPSWYTAYTPYQAEISQGRLELLLVFQTMVANLCGLAMANASLLDESTAAAEAMAMLRRAHKGEENVFIVDADTHPQNLAVLRTRAEPLGIELREFRSDDEADTAGAFGALLSNPGSSGRVADRAALVGRLREQGVRVAVCTDILACALLKPPGAMGASVAVGSCQRFGMPMGAGGPHAGFIAFEEDLVRQVPGRVVGISKDSRGRKALRLALQTREQHIRRDRATSNICTAQVLPAMVAAAYAVYHGPQGLKAIAQGAHRRACEIAAAAEAAGLKLAHGCFFDTVRVEASDPESVAESAAEREIDVRCGDGWVGIACDETTTGQDVAAVLEALGIKDAGGETKGRIGASLLRDGEILTQPVFRRHGSEHGLLRYLRRLAQKDVALDRSMIPLGSCTMKLNAATEMQALTDPGWCDVHPFCPPERDRGFRALAVDLGGMLTAVTGFDAVSFQPNAGAQGEYAGLLAIREFHRSAGEGGRDVCLVPQSAHGTNPASAVMAGMEVVPVAVLPDGEIDLGDLEAKADANAERLAALMVTYPSTSGTYGTNLVEICEAVHTRGGQVYMDGANLNALVCVSLPGSLGVDVMHINLHKTFCIPHGGGGPGMGPIVCKAHLEPHLPGHPFAREGRREGAVSSAPFGSGALLAISWAYMRMLGPAGLRRATAVAVLSANHMLDALRGSFDLAFPTSSGKVAHEFVLDVRKAGKEAGVTVEDVAKRLADFGFHAPTISFPSPGALMVEPTESEPLDEMDRYCEALLRIREEIDMVARGKWPKDDNPLVNAPHTAEDLLCGEGPRACAAAEAAYPLGWVRRDKYWPPVSRIDQVFGDRNLRCVLGPAEDLDGEGETGGG